ncbi:hypothetical protein PG995_011085 [Apiospora arundinis]|uniref:Type I 3-dehydroquinase-domain-containing protein n=1 Tax=Apiospora arundinis TaxID=335852 RepID=A0ABR2IWD0_9PEZI
MVSLMSTVAEPYSSGIPEVAGKSSFTSGSLPNLRSFHPDATIVLVGCRGAGKRTLGFIGATYLHRRLLTEDHCFEQGSGCTRARFLEQYGREAFQAQMATILAQVLHSNRTNCIIECSMATLHPGTQELLRQYSETNPVIYVHRDKEDIYRLLKLQVTEAERLFAIDQKHRECTNLEYFNLLDKSGEEDENAQSSARSVSAGARLLQAKNDFAKFLDLITGRSSTRSWVENPFSINAIPPEYRPYSYILRLRLSVLLSQQLNMEELECSGDAVELIIDTWPDNIFDVISTQVALIRRMLDMPIVFHIEENPREERQRPLEERDTTDTKLILHGLRLGVEYLSLDLERSESLVTQALAMRGRTKIIAAFCFRGLNAPKWSEESYIHRYQRSQALGCSVVRFTRFCTNDRDDHARMQFLKRIDALPDPKPQLAVLEYSVFGSIIYDIGSTPKQSLKFQPVGHEAIEASSREYLNGVNTTRGIIRNMFRLGPLQPLKFYTLGSKVYYSVSPVMHRAAYDALMLSHTFDARQCSELEEIDRIRCEPNFGGASLAAPFKVAMLSRVDHLSSHATAIGAVNTLLPLRGATDSILDHANARNTAGSTTKCYGDNTDWSAIMACLRRAISPRNAVQPSRTTGLVIGAGGMARAAIYALIKLGCRKIFIYNRTRANAEKVAEHFNTWASEQRIHSTQHHAGHICHVLDSTTSEWPAGYQQPTMIVSCIAAAGDRHGSVDFQVPPQWLKSPTGGVVVELAYEPLITSLIRQMRRVREEGGTSWFVVDGLEAVCEMAMEAFELMTGRQAPKTLMRRVCNETWEKNFAPFEPRR